MSHKSLSRG